MKTLLTFPLLAALLPALALPAFADVALTADKINGDRDGIATGAGRQGPYKPVPAGYGTDTINKWVAAHKAAKGDGYKYVYVPADVASNADQANILRVAAGKAWNHLSWKPEIDVPEDASEGTGLVLALNAKKIWDADAETNWGYLAGCTPKRNISVSPAPRGDCANFPAGEPVAIPRFVYNATNGGPYANVHKTPPQYGSFRAKFKPTSITHVSTHKEAIVCGPRITAYRKVTVNGQELLYSYSSDEFDGRDKGAIRYKNAPTDKDQRGTGALNAGPNDGNTAIAAEWWIQMPNGFIYYSIHGEGSQERGKAEFPFAIDPANWKQGATLATGRSCITCHAQGIQSAPSDSEFEGKNGWTSNADLKVLYDDSRTKFQRGMRALVDGLSDGGQELNERLISGTIEPISKAIRIIEGPFKGQNGSCRSFCNGKYGPSRGNNLCESLPEK